MSHEAYAYLDLGRVDHSCSYYRDLSACKVVNTCQPCQTTAEKLICWIGIWKGLMAGDMLGQTSRLS